MVHVRFLMLLEHQDGLADWEELPIDLLIAPDFLDYLLDELLECCIF